ncbi:MAG: sulfatase-like hydrolase/transferase [Chloroflexota bacterium]
MVATSRPNLLYIHSDQHNPYVTGCYGDPIVQTPNLDRLAANGVVFENTYCPSPICVPSRMSMLTGQHPYQNEVWTNDQMLHSGIPTLAHAMGAGGYTPVLIGRMHAMGPDQLHGYAERLVGDHTENYIGSARSVDRGILNGTAGPERVSLERSGSGQMAYQVHDEYVTAATVDYLNQLGVRKRAGEAMDPFSLSVGLMCPHPPYVARKEDFDLYKDTISMPRKPRAYEDETHPHFRWWREDTGSTDVSDEEVHRARAAYWGLVTRVDAMIGQMLDALRDNDFLENTLIIYTSDHGDMLGEHGLWWKHVFYEESVKVPLIVSWPGVIEAGQRCENVVSALDVNATILDALGAPALPSSSGRSFLPLINGSGQTDWDDVAFSEYCQYQYCPDGGCYQRMIRDGYWKLIYYHGQPPQLFNLADDPDEFVDRASDLDCQDIVETLTTRILDGWDPEKITATIQAMRANNDILKAWAKNTNPPDIIRWELKPEMNYLDDWDG